MAKSANGSKKPTDSNAETEASYSKKENANPPASENNPSKYAPTDMAVLDAQSLDAEDGLLKLFTDSVKDLYWAENCLVKALPKMANSASAASLVDAIQMHLEETKVHVERLEQVFELLGKKAQAKKCDAMEGLTKEGEGVVEDTDPGTPARDLGIIMASQKVEHYEIASYTGLSKLAGKLGFSEVADLLNQNLNEEIDADNTLGAIADNK